MAQSGGQLGGALWPCPQWCLLWLFVPIPIVLGGDFGGGGAPSPLACPLHGVLSLLLPGHILPLSPIGSVGTLAEPR